MQKSLLCFLIISLFTVGTVYSATGAYSPVHVQHLKNCSPYTEMYKTQIQTGDEKSPYINLESTETIVGNLNRKCIIKSSVRSIDLGGREIISSKCALSKDQTDSIINKMMSVNANNDEQSRKELQDEMVMLMKDKNTCTVKNYLDDAE